MSPPDPHSETAAPDAPGRLFVYNGGLLTKGPVRRALELAGWRVLTGAPSKGDTVGVWGKSPTAPRGETVAGWTGAPVVRVEDAFLRSLHPGKRGEPPLGLMIDRRGVHFDGSGPSDLEVLLASHALDDAQLLQRAHDGIRFLRDHHLSKYAACDPALPVPEAGFVLVIDQTRGDASITHGGASETTFREMLVAAQLEHPGARIVIKSHPETAAGLRRGHFGRRDISDQISVLGDPVSPWNLLDAARAVYTVSSGMGFDAILTGHAPRVFGQPWYAGWGLSIDEAAPPRRTRSLTAPQLFACAMLLAPVWIDPYRDRLCSFEEAAQSLAARARAWREDRHGYVASAMSLWKRPHLEAFFGGTKAPEFRDPPANAVGRANAKNCPALVWAGKMPEDLPLLARQSDVRLLRVEDGFLRSAGLGAALTPPLSLVCDDLGIYYDPMRESRLERLISESVNLPPAALVRSAALIRQLRDFGLSKYNTGTDAPPDAPGPDPDAPRILVAGQVEDDASVLTGCGPLRSNLALLAAAREANPDACLIYKPHPDVTEGLRAGAIGVKDLARLADTILVGVDPARALAHADEVWTMTSLLGFEALIRGLPVTCLGAPFYAGWGLTRDLGPAMGRRTARPSLEALAHAALIEYPRYLDPVSGLACPVEVAVERLVTGDIPHPPQRTRLMSWLQRRVRSRR